MDGILFANGMKRKNARKDNVNYNWRKGYKNKSIKPEKGKFKGKEMEWKINVVRFSTVASKYGTT